MSNYKSTSQIKIFYKSINFVFAPTVNFVPAIELIVKNNTQSQVSTDNL